MARRFSFLICILLMLQFYYQNIFFNFHKHRNSVGTYVGLLYGSDPQAVCRGAGIRCAANFYWKLYLNVSTFSASKFLYVILKV
jgi:hypothetical protein